MIMKRENLTTKTVHELRQSLSETTAALAKLRFDLADKKLTRTSDIKKARVTIARIQTAIKNQS